MEEREEGSEEEERKGREEGWKEFHVDLKGRSKTFYFQMTLTFYIETPNESTKITRPNK